MTEQSILTKYSEAETTGIRFCIMSVDAKTNPVLSLASETWNRAIDVCNKKHRNPRFTFEKLYARISHRQRRLKGYVSL